MNESGLIRKMRLPDSGGEEFQDITEISPNIWRVTFDGKYWLLKSAKADDSNSVQLLRREYELSRNILHPFILSASRFLPDSPKGPAIMMEYVEGENLRDFLSRNPPASSRRKILSQILDAVEYLHHTGMLHNDIKAENILITAIGGDVKLIDFGLAENDADFLNRKLGGTAGASAPEVLDGNVDVRSDASSDIFALGGIIKILFPRQYKRVVRHCRKANPTSRYRDVNTLRLALKRADRRPRIIVGIVLLLCVVSVAVVQGIRKQKGEAPREPVPEQTVKEKLPDGMKQIRATFETFYKAAADSINNPSQVHFQEFASKVVANYAVRFGEYQKTLAPEEQQACYAIYEEQLLSLKDMQNALPSFSELHDRKQMSSEEYMFYLNLRTKNKPYKPYRK